VIAVTGPYRSGTSCVAGCLERCGLSLGTRYKVLRVPDEFNEKGHYELGIVVTINTLLLGAAGGCWSQPPDPVLIENAADKHAAYFGYFERKFDGELFKDPHLCLTFSCWEKYVPAIDRVIFCLRHPRASADSMARRYGIEFAHALRLWREYTYRFFSQRTRSSVWILDYDVLCSDPVSVLGATLQQLGRPRTPLEIAVAIEGFFDPELNHAQVSTSEGPLPEDTDEMYRTLRKQGAAQRQL
jgi:hypothetical protein